MEFFWKNEGQQQDDKPLLSLHCSPWCCSFFRPPPHVSQVAPGDFHFPESILSGLPSEPPVSGYGNPALLPPDLCPSAYTSHAASATFSHQFMALTSWDDEPSSWLPHSAEQQIPARWDDASGQPHWDDFASSSRSAPAYFSTIGPMKLHQRSVRKNPGIWPKKSLCFGVFWT
ncbi:hypothetical protein K438DRAFT_347527 [Mycena galopus ATCC 62051]|nr:hypothetical protein K438DRAFT_347527 [Mycena galopus ATCC 62051]